MTNTSPYCPYSIPVHKDCSSVSWVYDYINYVKKKVGRLKNLSIWKQMTWLQVLLRDSVN